ncbi:T9SS type A sorting domain-containing protein [Vicingaceae bacterium]|nr:T9SS type A sorting domain-containing protein [Vicingaceae bacterium]
MVLVEVYDMKGAMVLSLPTRQNKVQLSLTEYRNGFYMVRAQMQDETWRMKKVIKM